MPPKTETGSSKAWTEPVDLGTAVKLLSGPKSQVIRAVDSVCKILSTKSVAKKLHEDERGCSWYITVLEALFEAVLEERTAIIKAERDEREKNDRQRGNDRAPNKRARHPAAAAVTRIEQLAQAVRFIVGQSHTMFNKGAFRKVYEHLLQASTNGDQPFSHVCQPYIKAIRTMLTHHPHVEHMDELTWKALMNWCWNLLLGEPLNEDQRWGDAGRDGLMAIDKPIRQRESTSSNAQARSAILPVTVEIFGIIMLLLESPMAPIIPRKLNDEHNTTHSDICTGTSVMNRIVAYLAAHYTDIGSHLPLIRSANIIFKELELNSLSRTAQHGVEFLPYLVSLWSTRKADLRAQVLIALKILLPHLGREATWKQGDHVEETIDQLAKLLLALEGEVSGPLALTPLAMSNVRLAYSEEKVKDPPLHYRVISAGSAFSEDMVTAWTTMELRADLSLLLNTILETKRDEELPPSRATKRRRIEDPIQRLVAATSDPGSCLIALQTLTFFISRHWTQVIGYIRADTREHLLQLLGDSDPEVDSWVMIALSALMAAEEDDETPSDRQGWTRLWQHAVRRFTLPGTCRCAALVLQVSLSSSTLSKSHHRSDIDSVLSDIDLQGPSFPYDSVCAFLSTALEYASTDVRLYRKQLESKVLRWLVGNWSVAHGTTVGFNVRARIEPHLPADLLGLLSRICRFEVAWQLHTTSWDDVLPDCHLVTWLHEEYRTRPIRQFYLFAKLPTAPAPAPIPVVTTAGGPRTQSDLDLPRGTANQTILFLEKCCGILLTEWASSPVLQTATPEKVRRTIDLAIVVAAFQALLIANGLNAATQTTRLASELLSVITPCLNITSFGSSGRALIWKGFAPLLQSAGADYLEAWPALVSPTRASGIRQDILPSSRLQGQHTLPAHENGDYRSLQSAIWGLEQFTSSLTDLGSLCRSSLESAIESEDSEADVSDAQTPIEIDNDDFAPIRDSTFGFATSATINADRSRGPASSCLLIWVQFLTVGPTLLGETRRPVKDNSLLNTLIKSEPEDFLRLASPVFSASSGGFLRIGLDAIEQFLDLLKELLGSHRYARHEQLHLMALDFLEATMRTWQQDSVIESELGGLVGDFIDYYCHNVSTGKESMWRVRLRVLLLLHQYFDRDPLLRLWPDPLPAGELHPAVDTAVLAGADVDVRVRFHAASLTATLVGLDLEHSTGLRAEGMYTKACESFFPAAEGFEGQLSTLLFQVNVCIASGVVRSKALYQIYERLHSTHTTINTTSTSVKRPVALHSLHGLEAAAERLGLGTLSSLYIGYARSIIIQQSNMRHSPVQVPLLLYGYKTQRSWAEAVLPAAGHIVLFADAVDVFLQISQAAEVLATHAAQFLSPATVAAAYGVTQDPATVEVQGSTDPENIDIALKTIYGRLQDKLNPFESAKEDYSLTVAYLLSMLSGTETNQSCANVLATGSLLRGQQSSEVFLDIVGRAPQQAAGTSMEPSVTMDATLQALQLLENRLSPKWGATQMISTSVTLMTEMVMSTPIIDEQRRGMRSLGLALALFHQGAEWFSISSPVLKHLLQLMGQAGVASTAFSMFAWVMKMALVTDFEIPQLPEMLVQLSELSFLYISSSDATLQDLGRESARWLKDVLKKGPKSSNLGKATRQAELFLDTTSPSSDEMSLALLTETLCNPRINIDKSLLALPLLAASKITTIGDIKFSTSILWQFKAAFGSSDGRSDDQNMAFLDLVHLSGGRVDTPDLDTISLTSFAARSPFLSLGHKRIADAESYIKASIVAEMYDLSWSTNPVLARKSRQSLSALLYCSPAVLQSPAIIDSVRKELLQVRQSVFLRSSSRLEHLADIHSIRTSGSNDFHTWIIQFSLILVDSLGLSDDFFDSLKDVIRWSSDMAARCLPALVHCLLLYADRKVEESSVAPRKVISEHFNQVVSSSSSEVRIVGAVLDVVKHLRHYTPAGSTDPEAYDTWLDVDYHEMSRCAARCGQYATSLLFLEKAVVQTDGSQHVMTNEILYDVYSNVDDPDGFYGIRSTEIKQSLLRRYHHEGQWSQAFEQHAAIYQTGAASSKVTDDVLVSLEALGFHRIASHLITNLRETDNGTGGAVEPIEYEVAWRNGNWDLPTAPASLQSDSRMSLYTALRAAARERHSQEAIAKVYGAIRIELQRLNGIGFESITRIRDVVKNLLSLREVACCLQTYTSKSLGTVNDEPSTIPSYDFSTAEQALSARVSVLQSLRAATSIARLGNLGTSTDLLAAEKSCQLQLSRLAREDGRVQSAINAITAVNEIESTAGGQLSFVAKDEFSQVLWAQGEFALAIQQLAELCTSLSSPNVQKVITSSSPRTAFVNEAKLRARLAQWTHQAKLEPSESIRKQFALAHKLIDTATSHGEEQAEIYHSFAVFLDKQHSLLVKSPELNRLRTFRDRKKTQLSSLELQVKASSRRQTAELQSIHETAAKELQADTDAVQELEKTTRLYIQQALKMYGKSLASTDAFNDTLIRLVTLWMEHSEDQLVQSIMSTLLQTKIASWKFVFLGPQLAARLHMLPPGSASQFQDLLNGLMLRLAREHPYQILYQVITLSHGHQLGKKKIYDTATGRGIAAAAILEQLATTPEQDNRVSVQKVTRDMRLFSNASVKWCTSKPPEEPKNARGEISLPSSCPLLALRRLQIPVATQSVKIDPTSQYANVPTLVRYTSKFRIAGGLSRPSILTCIDTEDRVHTQLFKRGDDVRKDAVMEQVFQTVNDLLLRDRRARERRLLFRTYTVIPLAERNGLIEFVGNTHSIGDWLLPAHRRYRTQDITPEDFRKGIRELQEKEAPTPQIVKRWQDQMKKFKPVMRHFFVERHKEPMAWLTMRLAYARSTAVSSMVGHMVGLGDRHCSNILIDRASGELVHIDLGIAFDEGRDLRIPERVPFRLTNDLVDGFGISGVDGTFRRCSQETLRVLRESSGLIMTVLEVFKHDPLQAWGVTPEKAARMQAERGGVEPALLDATTAQSDKADRILARIAGKLSPDLSVEYTVNQLIQEARDPERLATIFTGWQSWL